MSGKGKSSVLMTPKDESAEARQTAFPNAGTSLDNAGDLTKQAETFKEVSTLNDVLDALNRPQGLEVTDGDILL